MTGVDIQRRDIRSTSQGQVGGYDAKDSMLDIILMLFRVLRVWSISLGTSSALRDVLESSRTQR